MQIYHHRQNPFLERRPGLVVRPESSIGNLPGKLPSWIFSKDKFILLMNNLGYKVMVEWKNPDTMPAPIEVAYQGMMLVKK